KLLATLPGGSLNSRGHVGDVNRRLDLVSMLSSRPGGAAKADLAVLEQDFFFESGGVGVRHSCDSISGRSSGATRRNIGFSRCQPRQSCLPPTPRYTARLAKPRPLRPLCVSAAGKAKNRRSG